MNETMVDFNGFHRILMENTVKNRDQTKKDSRKYQILIDVQLPTWEQRHLMGSMPDGLLVGPSANH